MVYAYPARSNISIQLLESLNADLRAYVEMHYGQPARPTRRGVSMEVIGLLVSAVIMLKTMWPS